MQEALTDLSEALRLSPQNRDVHKFIIKVKEEMSNNINNNNNNNKEEEEDSKKGPVGAREDFEFVDEASTGD